MSTLHKVKAYFGMAPMDDYDDEYYDDDRDAGSGPGNGRGPSRYARRSSSDRFADDGYDRPAGRRYESRDFDDPRDVDDFPPGGYRGGYDEPRYESRLRGPRDFDRPEMSRSRFASLRGATRGALAMDPRRMAMLFECMVGRGRLMVAAFDFSEAGLGKHAGAPSLKSSVLSYMGSSSFKPKVAIPAADLDAWMAVRYVAPAMIISPPATGDVADPNQTPAAAR